MLTVESKIIARYAGQKGWGKTNTLRRDRLPKGVVPDKHFHKRQTDLSQPRTKAARQVHPVIAVKKEKDENGHEFELVIVSFHST